MVGAKIIATNIYFRNIRNSNEQDLFEGMIIEAISIYGEDLIYVIRSLNSFDKIYGEDDTSSFSTAVPIEMYIDNPMGFGGDGTLLDRFDIDIKDRMTFTVAKKRFDADIGVPYGLLRPNEGDLIYFPLNNKCFQIKTVTNKSMFYQLGRLYTYAMDCELFDYSNESFSTGIPEIDSLETTFSLNVLDHTLADASNIVLTTEEDQILVDEVLDIQTIDPGADNDSIQSEGNNIMDWSETSPFVANGTF